MITTADIPPGGEGEIEVTLNTAHKKGQLEKIISVESNDPDQPNAKLRIKAFAEVSFGFESYSLAFGNVQRGDSATRTAYLIIKDTVEIKITEVTTSSEFISARVADSITRDGDSYKIPIEVILKPGLKAGQLRESVNVTSNLPNNLGSSLRLIGNIVGDVVVSPESISFNIFNPEDSLRDQIVQYISILYRSEERPLKIEHIQDSNNRLDIALDTINPGHKFKLIATLKNEIIEMGGNYSGYIVISTDDPEQKTARIRYQIANRNKK